MPLTSPQCPYCPALMVFLRDLNSTVEWLCPACKTTKITSLSETTQREERARGH